MQDKLAYQYFEKLKRNPKIGNTEGTWSIDGERDVYLHQVMLPKEDDITYNIFLDLPSMILLTKRVGYVTSTKGKSEGSLELKSAQDILSKPVTINELTVSAS